MDTSDSIFFQHFSIVPDPRIDRSKKHPLLDVIAVAVLAALCGIDSFEGFAMFAKMRIKWLKQFLSLPEGPPSADTFGRVFARIDPASFQEAFIAWIADVAKIVEGEVVAIDGKTLRRSFDKARETSPIHMVSAWAVKSGICLGQIKVNEKSNEITAIPKLVEALCLKGCVVTIDAMGCQRDIAEKIIEAKADYTIALKGNQPSLHRDVIALFCRQEHSKTTVSLHEKTKGHGRTEERTYIQTSDIDVLRKDHDWPGLTSVGRVRSIRIVDGKRSVEHRYYLNSYGSDVKRFAHAVRGHWGVENGLHWVLDVTYGDDSSRARIKNAAENLSTVRRVAINMLKRQPTEKKTSIRGKQIMCAHSEEFLLKVLTS
jgi:predicted transposase YbfD/YdcC